MSDVQTHPDSSAALQPAAVDPVTALRKMSTTAGVGSQDYVAINSVAIAAVLLGVASVLAFLHEVLLLVPLAGIVCAILAWRQVRQSNGTQTGIGLALVGMALSILIGCGSVAAKVVTGWTNRPEERAVADAMQELGAKVSARNYDAAYAFFSDRFKQRVDKSHFEVTFDDLAKNGALGGVRSIEFNGRVVFEEDPGTGGRVAWAGSLVSFDKPAEPGRWQFRMSKTGGRWLVDDLPEVFPPDRRPKRK